MKTAVIGFPRIGKERELKFASESYFAGRTDAVSLEQTAASLRAYGWKKQADAGIDFIPSNDFSFYDNMLDTAVMLGVVPERYRALSLSELDTCFAMARGYQGTRGDVTALPMKKWFNTNYHYLVPELEDAMTIASDAAECKPVREYAEAKSAGYDTVPSLIGPYTFLHLALCTGKKTKRDFAADVVNAYEQVIAELAKRGASWIQIAEPALVRDVPHDDDAFFTSLYRPLLDKTHSESGVRVLLQTYFSDIRDVYDNVCALGFDGIGLDFVEGRQNLPLIKKNGFPEQTVLFAGVVCGKNIWRAEYEKKCALVKEIETVVKSKDRVVLGTSCSLLHVPYTTAGETKLPHDVLAHFSFAEEKLSELHDIAAACENGGTAAVYGDNKKLFASLRVTPDDAVARRVSALSRNDFERKPAFSERERIQKKEFSLPLFPTTTIGSFPQTKDVRANRSAFKKGAVSREEYIAFNKKKIASCIALQEKIGLDVLVHGEYERNDMVEYFGDHLDGYVFTEKAWVQSYGTRCVKPPVIWGDVSRRGPITVEWSVFAQSCTKKPVKGMLTGPVTILNWSFPREDISLKEQALQIAFAIRDEVLDLEKNGIRIIQIDEAALREKLPLLRADWHTDYLDWAVSSFRLVHSGVKPETQIHTHMCYSELGDIIKDIDDMDADVITFEASRSDLTILDALKTAKFRTEVGPGVYDIHSPRVPSTEEIKTALEKMLQKIPAEKLWVNPDCGLKTRGEEETVPSLEHLAAAAKLLRKEYAEL